MEVDGELPDQRRCRTQQHAQTQRYVDGVPNPGCLHSRCVFVSYHCVFRSRPEDMRYVVRSFTQVVQLHEEGANISLIRVGLLGCSPTAPTLSFSLRTLEFYHRLRRRHPRLGIMPFVRSLCDLHEVREPRSPLMSVAVPQLCGVPRSYTGLITEINSQLLSMPIFQFYGTSRNESTTPSEGMRLIGDCSTRALPVISECVSFYILRQYSVNLPTNSSRTKASLYRRDSDVWMGTIRSSVSRLREPKINVSLTVIIFFLAKRWISSHTRSEVGWMMNVHRYASFCMRYQTYMVINVTFYRSRTCLGSTLR